MKNNKFEFESNLRLTRERETDLVNLIAECTVVENQLRDHINFCTQIGASVTTEDLVNKYNDLKLQDPYYNKITERKPLVDNCMMNVIHSLIYEYNSKKADNKTMNKVGFKRQIKISNDNKSKRVFHLSPDTPNTVSLLGIGDIKMTKLLRTSMSSIEKITISRFDKIKITIRE